MFASVELHPVDPRTKISGISIGDLDFDAIDETQPRASICIPPKEPPPEEDIKLSTSEVRWLQSALTVDNRNPGPIDGRIGPLTQRALNAWQADNNRPVTPLPPDGMSIPKSDFQEIIRVFSERFGQVQDIVSVF